MKHLKKTAGLLFEPSFLTFARQVNEGFAMLDKPLYESLLGEDNAFNITTKMWLHKCRNVDLRRTRGEYSVSFLNVAGEEAEGIIRQDWQDFEANIESLNNKDREVAIKELLHEVKKKIVLVAKKVYLEPIRNQMTQSLEGIIAHYGEANNEEISNSSSRALQTIIWRGDASVLCALFIELRNQTMKDGKQTYLAAGDNELAKFIHSNFQFWDDDKRKEIAESTILRYIQGKLIKKCINLNYNELKK